jgi:hypothetical protein
MNNARKRSQTFCIGGTAAILLSALVLFALGSGATGSNNGGTAAYAAEMMEEKSNHMMTGDSAMKGKADDSMTMMAMENNKAGPHVIKGQISNVQVGGNGQPEWIQSGIWVARITNAAAGAGSEKPLPSVNLIARFSMIKPDGTSAHQHSIYNFKVMEMTMEGNSTHVLKGTATVTMPGGPVNDVPLTVKVFNNSVVGFWIGPDKVNGHFGSNPIFGILSLASKGMMNDMMSMMMVEGGTTTTMEQNLTKTALPVTLPLTRGYANGHEVFYISTEASDKGLADHLTNVTGSRVAYAPSLSHTPASSLANIYAFKNGIAGSGPLGFQPNVADSQPGDAKYSPIWRIITVEWKQGISATELKSEQEILAAAQEGKVTIEPTSMLVNCPFVQWEGGKLMERADKALTDKSPYGPGQVLSIDTQKMQVTFVAHRGFAPDGSTIYYIATDASSQDAAKALGVTFVNKTAGTVLSGASSDLYVFTNGIKGTGPMGFQASIAGSNVGDTLYSPLWRINAATWKDPSMAKFLTTSGQISSEVSDGMLSTAVAGFVVNCPFVEVDAA